MWDLNVDIYHNKNNIQTYFAHGQCKYGVYKFNEQRYRTLSIGWLIESYVDKKYTKAMNY